MNLFTMFSGSVNNHRPDDKLMRHLMRTQTQDHPVEVSVELLVCLDHIWIVRICERIDSRRTTCTLSTSAQGSSRPSGSWLRRRSGTPAKSPLIRRDHALLFNSPMRDEPDAA